MPRISQKKTSILNTPRSGNILINTKTQLKDKDSAQNKEMYIAINGKDISYSIKTFNYESINNIDSSVIENLETANVYQLEVKKKYVFFPDHSQLVTLLTPINPKVDDFFCVVLDKNTSQHINDSNIFKIVYVIDRYNIDLTGVISFQRGNAFSTYTFYWDGYRWIRYENLSNNKKNVWNDDNIIFFDNAINVNQQTNFEIKHYSSSLSTKMIGNNRINIQKAMASPSKMGLLIKDNSITKKAENFIEYKNYLENCITPFKDYNFKKDVTADFVTGEKDYYFIDSNMEKESCIEIELDVPVDSLLEYTTKIQQQDLDDENGYFFSTWQNSPHYFRNISGPFSNIYLYKNRTNSPFLIYNFKEKCFESRGWSRKSQNEGNQITEIPDLNFEYLPILDVSLKPTTDTFTVFRDSLLNNLKNHNFALTHTPINDLAFYNYDSIIPDTSFTNNTLVINSQNSLSLPSMQYGFPYFHCFHLFDENVISMKNFINKNFIIDRVTAELDVKLQSETSANQSETDLDVSNGLKFSLNYFILNKPNNNKKTRKYLEISPFNISNITENIDKNDLNEDAQKINSITFSKIYSTNINNPKLQNLSIFRKLFKSRHQNENNTYDGLTTPITSVITLDNTSFNKDIVTFGNVVLFSPNKNKSFTQNELNQYTESQQQEITRAVNNCDKFIDTFKLNNFDKNQLDNNLIFLDFDNHITINSYVKKSSHTNLQFASNNFNYQIDFKSTLGIDSKEITAPGELKLSSSKFFKRSMLSQNQSGKDILNHYSLLQNKNTIAYASKTSLNLFKNMKNIAGELWSDGDDQIFHLTDEYFKNYINISGNSNFEVKKNTNFSPYLLTPNDNLAFGFSISPNISPKLFKHNCNIKKGKVIFKLYGYLQKNSEKLNDWTNVTTQNQENINTNIIGNTFIENEKYNIGYLDEYILTTLDRIYYGIPFYQAFSDGKLFNNAENDKMLIKDNPDVRRNHISNIDSAVKLLITSKIFSGRSYSPVIKLNESTSNVWIYDDDKVYNFILNKLLSTNNLNIDDNNLDEGNKEYADYNIAATTTIFKRKIKNLQSALDILPKCNFTCYFSFKRYGQFADLWQQRLYSTLVFKKNKNINDEILHVVTQEFIDSSTGVQISNMQNVMNRNKSQNLELYNSGYQSISDTGVITQWNGNDYFNLKHVAFFE